MGTPALPLKEFDLEMASTRKLLERVPSDKAAWKPHDKSFALGHLAQLVSWMPGWIATSLREPQIDLTKGSGYSLESTDALLKTFDANVRDARACLCRLCTGQRRTNAGSSRVPVPRSCSRFWFLV